MDSLVREPGKVESQQCKFHGPKKSGSAVIPLRPDLKRWVENRRGGHEPLHCLPFSSKIQIARGILLASTEHKNQRKGMRAYGE